MIQESIKFISIILYSTESRTFLLSTNFFPMVREFSVLNSNNFLILSIFSSPAELTSDIIETFSPYLKSFISVDFPNDSYRVFLAYLSICQCGNRIDNSILSNSINTFLHTDLNYMIEILMKLVFFLENPHPYLGWIISNISSSDLVVMRSSIDALFRNWNKWTNDEKAHIINVIDINISDFPFVAQKECAIHIMDIGNEEWMSNVCIFEKLIILLDDEECAERALLIICKLIVRYLSGQDGSALEMLNILKNNVDILENLMKSMNENIKKMSSVLIESLYNIKIVD